MSCNLSPVSESLLFLQIALAFSACTWFLDPLSLGHLGRYRGSGTFAAGGAETDLGLFYGCMATCFSMVISCCCSLKLSIWLLVTACPCFSLVPASRVLKEFSISNSSLTCPWWTGWCHGVCSWNFRRQLWAAFGWCLRSGCRTISATGIGALCTWAARWGNGQRHKRLTRRCISIHISWWDQVLLQERSMYHWKFQGFLVWCESRSS